MENATETDPTTSRSKAAAPQRIERLLDQASWWVANLPAERVPFDRLGLTVECSSCGALAVHSIRLGNPWPDGSSPAFRGMDELVGYAASAARQRPTAIDGATWDAVYECPCGTPRHLRTVSSTAVFRMMLGTGAGLVVAHLPDASPKERFFRVPIGGTPIELGGPLDVETAFGRSLDLFDAWAALGEQLPIAVGQAAGVDVGPEAFLVAATDIPALRWAANAKLEGRDHLIVGLEPGGVEWPDMLTPVLEAVSSGTVVAFVIARKRLLDEARAYARMTLGMDLVEDGGAVHLRAPQLSWPITLDPIALGMAKFGAQIGLATAVVLAAAAEAAMLRVQTLQRLADRVPGGSFQVVGTRVVALRPDGVEGREVDLRAIPPGDSEISDEELARQASFLFELAPRWADPTRVCPCGAAATVERRLVAWPWTSDAAHAPRPLEILEDTHGAKVAVVAGLSCDRHVRVPSATELERLGLGAEELERRIKDDAPRRTQRLRAWVHRSDAGLAILAEAPMVSALAIDDGRLAALHKTLGDPIVERGDVFAWAVGTDVLVVGTRAAGLAALDARGRSQDAVPFVLERRADLAHTPSGLIDLARDRPRTP